MSQQIEATKPAAQLVPGHQECKQAATEDPVRPHTDLICSSQIAILGTVVILKRQSDITAQSEVGAITRLVVKHAREAFQGLEAIASEWQALNFTAAPDFARAVNEYEGFLALLGSSDCEITTLPKAEGVGLDSIYVRDASVVCDRGVILCNMGKQQRANEPAAVTARTMQESPSSASSSVTVSTNS